MNKNHRLQTGQAMSEVLIATGLVGMLLLSAASLYQLFNADLKATKAARLAAWHGVLYQGLTEAQFEQKYRSNIQATILDRSAQETELIGRTAGGRETVIDAGAIIEFDYESVDPTFAFPSNRSTYVANMAGLNDNTVRTVSVSLPLGDLLITKRPDDSASWGNCRGGGEFDSCSGGLEDVMPAFDPVAGEYRASLIGKAALLSNGFVPQNEEVFSDAIANISADGGPMTAFAWLRAPLTWLGFDEVDAAMGEDGLSTVAVEQSRIVPPELGTFE